MSDLLYEVKDKVATITLNRPDKLNAFTRDMIDAWAKALTAAQQDDSVNVVVVTGTGRAFCSGGDVGRMREGEPARSTARTASGRASTGCRRRSRRWTSRSSPWSTDSPSAPAWACASCATCG